MTRWWACTFYLAWCPKPPVDKGSAFENPFTPIFSTTGACPSGEGNGWGGCCLAWAGSLYAAVGGWIGWALKAARQLLLDGQFPFAIAPEGATNGHSERINPLEPGTAQLCFWCAEDLAKAGRSETVILLPIGIRYYYTDPSWTKLERLLARLEHLSGLTPPKPEPRSSRSPNLRYTQRICRLAQHLLGQLEAFYDLPPFISGRDEEEPRIEQRLAPGHFNARLERLLHRALETAETYFGLSPQGDWNSRCRRIEEVAWIQIYREELRHPGSLSPLQRGLLDWKAHQATLYLQHMRLVESCVAVQEEYLLSKPSFERLAETALILFDVLARLRGESYPARPRLGWRGVHVTVGDPISVSERLGAVPSRPPGSHASGDRANSGCFFVSNFFPVFSNF
jgi:hypothetical protein